MTSLAFSYLHSEVGKLAEDLKKAYLAGQHIVYVIAPDPEVVRETLRIEPIFKLVNKESPKTSSAIVEMAAPLKQNLKWGLDGLANFPSRGVPSICVVCSGIDENENKKLNELLRRYVYEIFDLTYRNEKRETAMKSMVIVVTPVVPEIPADIVSECRIVRVSPPENWEIRKAIISAVEKLDGIKLEGKPGLESFLNSIVENTKGLTLKKIAHAFSRIKAELDQTFILPDDKERFASLISIIIDEKGKLIENSGILKLQKSSKAQKSVDGMANLTEWLQMRAPIINKPQDANEKALIGQPKGLLVSGIPGTGKSLAAKTAASQLGGLPLIQLDMGNIMDKYQGESERKLEEALKLTEAMSPCILWIDEIEKGMAGASSGSGSDSMQRIFGKLLTWMQEKENRGVCCFVFATANSIDCIPPEFFRSGRFDEKFFTFLPSAEECVDIFLGNISSQNKKFRVVNAYTASEHRQLFDPAINDRGFFMDILNSDKVIRETAKVGDRRPSIQNKFMTGSDIEALIDRAKLLMYNSGKTEPVTSDYVYGASKFREALEQALNEAQTYSQTNPRDIALCYSKLAAYNFKPVSKKVIAPFNLYTELTEADLEENKDAKPFDLNTKEAKEHISKLTSEYDRQLLIYVSVAVNRFLKPTNR